jgi:lipoprotein-anchoring transpeptidase ErfK/SrfK
MRAGHAEHNSPWQDATTAQQWEPQMTRHRTHRPITLAVLGAGMALALTASLAPAAAASVRTTGNAAGNAAAPDGHGNAARQQDAAEEAAARLFTLSPSAGSSGVSTTLPVKVTATSGKLASVVITDPSGTTVPGTLNPDDTTWTADRHLLVNTRYTVHAQLYTPDGQQVERDSTFVTFQPANTLQLAQVAPNNGDTVGTGMPVVLRFQNPVTNKAAVERSLAVSSVPAQVGHWSWLSDDRLDYRPEQPWQVGTKVSVALRLDGVDAGGGEYGTSNQVLNFTVGRSQHSVVNLDSHQMTVYQGDNAVQTFPITGGMPGLDTWGGTMVVIDKTSLVDMNSETVGLGSAYNLMVRWAVHITDSGTFVHAAPWSEGSQGYANVSHGCVGMSTANAEWFYGNSITGDMITIVGSPKQVSPTNGYGDWQLSWRQWLAGSAV